MATSRNSSTSASSAPGARLRALAAWALAPVVVANAWIGWRLDALLHPTEVGTFQELEARVARVARPERVKLLVFGNSHAQHALRPPSLGPALGLAPDEIFNLALPGTTAFELGLHVRRWLPRFPGATQAIVGVDEVLLTVFPWFQQGRVKWLARSVDDRLRYAGYFQEPEGRFSNVAWLAAPAGDFAQSLRAAFRAEPRAFVACLLVGDAGRVRHRDHDRPYAWGYPPLAELPAADRLKTRRRALAHPRHMAHLADIFFGAPYARPRSLEDLEGAIRALEARQLAVRLIAPPYAPALRAQLRRERAADVAAHRGALDAWLRATGRGLHEPACDPPLVEWLDADHLAEAGAARFARATAEAFRFPAPPGLAPAPGLTPSSGAPASARSPAATTPPAR